MNKYKKISKLNICTSFNGEKTVLEDVYFTAPFKVTTPFYNEDNDFMQIMQLSISPGIMEGDIQEIDITAHENAKVEIISQSYEKIHKMKNGFATRNCILTVEDNACLIYTPLPCIPYAQSSFKSQITAKLATPNSKLFLADIMACGRVGFGEKFSFDLYDSQVYALCGEELIYVDKTRLLPNKYNLNSFGFYEGYTHLATVLVANFPSYEKILNDVRGIIDEEKCVEGGATLTFSKSISIKILGNASQHLINIIDKIKHNCIETLL